ncbi:CK1 family protein kinase [Tritrichomonas foetus]|uniref:non-specific serine/threonine protein kinase n=1 Tax=Tritrichomonas foetus TaxID=1144522 RepID=A0A1J4KIT4_9EUKA|nr:CK1 family protein kinase [Tritrichomonas foetus]|eukprot:OHT11255.1 CK1 family protein kinase [Tritrichomonas foetus]
MNKNQTQMKKGRKVSNFVLNELIGRGGFGEVWAATSLIDHKPVAIKIERHSPNDSKRKLLADESVVLNKLSDSPCFPCFIQYWEDDDGCCFLAMELLESTVRKTTEAAFGGRLSLKQGASLGLQMLNAVESLHNHGFVHRDIKPGNFMYRPGNSPPDVCLIDFGLAKIWKNSEGDIIPQRYGVGFRGTSRYASVNSHDGVDLSCRDDIWSLLYLLVEMVAPPLPWHNQTNRETVAAMKRSQTARLVAGLPIQFQNMFEYLNGLSFEDVIDYEFFRCKLEEIKKIGENDEEATLNFAAIGPNRPMLVQFGNSNSGPNIILEESSSVVAISENDDAPLFERSFSKTPIKTPVVEKESQEPSEFRCCLLI